jgi:FdhD protein
MSVRIRKVGDSGTLDTEDVLAVEEPLEIRMSFFENGISKTQNISVTMRTPGNDDELVAGFLFTEGIISYGQQISSIQSSGLNTITVFLNENVVFEKEKLQRNFYTTSSCGVCGKSSIDAIHIGRNIYPDDNFRIESAVLKNLPSLVQQQQEVFKQTGGVHASALIDNKGNIELIREDVGRHNALDKIIGNRLLNNAIPLSDKLILLSGRASFELMQKSYMAGISFVAAVGAPSSLAVEFAVEKNMTLIGFLRENRFNIYSGSQRLIVNERG